MAKKKPTPQKPAIAKPNGKTSAVRVTPAQNNRVMQRDIDWSTIFAESFPNPGATAAELSAAIKALTAPLSPEELRSIAQSQTNPYPPGDPLYGAYHPFDPTAWVIPNRPFPSDFISFLRWSNGGSFFNHDRHFDPFLSCSELRRCLVGHHFPQYLPGAVPFALDGNGNFYFFDMRHVSASNQYPVLFTSAGDLRYEHSIHVADSFIEVCAGTTDPQAY